MGRKKTIEVLNALITINNDRIEGYETASKESEEQDLKCLFAHFISTSQQCKEELVSDLNALGGEATEGTKISGNFFRVWMDVKAALTGKDLKGIIDSCAYGEDEAQDTYENVLKNDFKHLSALQQTKIYDQKSLLKANYKQIKALRNALTVV